jgi:hypothetical protein
MCKIDDGICMSNLKYKTNRCKNRHLLNNDFCFKHVKNYKHNDDAIQKIIKTIDKNEIEDEYLDMILEEFEITQRETIKYFDENYNHGLLGLNDSWNEIPMMYWYKLDNCWWDIRTLIRTISSQLNQSELEKPFPIFPENPFNRNKIGLDDITNIKHKIKKLNLEPNIALKHFLSFTTKFLIKIREEENQYNAAVKIIKKLEKNLRYKMINYKDSQGRYCGYWVESDTKKSEFENCYEVLKDAAVFIDGMWLFIDSPLYRKNLKKINKLEEEYYN